jgi:hypothetical protein
VRKRKDHGLFAIFYNPKMFYPEKYLSTCHNYILEKEKVKLAPRGLSGVWVVLTAVLSI